MISGKPLRIAFLCKRRYMGKDVIKDRYARLYEIPFQLAQLGHAIRGICLDYHDHSDGTWTDATSDGELKWTSRSLGRTVVPGLIAHFRKTLEELRLFDPDLIICASDIPTIILARRIAARLRLPYAVDLYDNFEGFGQARIPGMKTMLRRATRSAALVTTTSEPLARYVTQRYQPHGRIIAMPSTVDKQIFRQRDRTASRHSLGLPLNAPLIGTAGGLHADKGVGTLYDAWRALSAQIPALRLVLAGPADSRLPPPDDPRVHYLGELPHARTAELFSALDVGVIYVRDTQFGRYCFPQKAYEMLACGLPVVSARVGAMADLLSSCAQCTYAPDDAADLARKIRMQLDAPILPDVPIDDWQTLIGRIEPYLHEITGR